MRRSPVSWPRFVGDAIMICFGAPDRIDDREHAVRAVCMAIDMQDALARLRDRSVGVSGWLWSAAAMLPHALTATIEESLPPPHRASAACALHISV